MQLYTPLRNEEIRLLRLHPGQSGSPLEADLQTAQLSVPRCDRNTSPAVYGIEKFRNVRKTGLINCKCNNGYEALSYVWGDAIFPNHVWLRGLGGVLITNSLYTALQHLRSTESVRSLWIDALCINQNDLG